ncbi:MAG: carboxylating nicotinate-nucleotide diphosphorylase [Alphaproteobacteria bacterium]
MTTVAALPSVIIEPLVRMALAEDLGRSGDITSNSTVPAETHARVVIGSREEGRIAGLDLAELAFKIVDPTLTVKRLKAEGSDVKKGDEIMEIEGKARSILTAERVALNFVGRMSGVATLTLKMVRAAGNHKARIAATRKTTPGLRAIEKYAVQVGGGIPHRYGLDDAILIKDNHIAMAGGVRIAIRNAKQNIGHTVKIECEVDTLAQLQEVLDEGVDIVMLDNMSLDDMTAAVKLVAGRAVIEASGGVTLDRIPKIAATGVDLISSGAITHSAPNFDVGLDFKSAA